jgi:hypothetical protein
MELRAHRLHRARPTQGVSRHAKVVLAHIRWAGVVLYMLGAAPTLGLIGATALAPTAAEARALYDRTAELMSGAARRVAA